MKEKTFEEWLNEFVDKFYNDLEDGKVKGFEYRPDQRTMSLNVMSSLLDKDISVQEAGVGSGKSWGYLVPLLGAYIHEHGKHGRYPGFIISTSSIALQEQLVKEIEALSKMFGVEIPVTVAKGKNNYVCPRRLESYLDSTPNPPEKEEIMRIIVDEKGYDKKSFGSISSQTWEKINVSNLNCRDCRFYESCPYQLQRRSWIRPGTNIITNHDMLLENLKRAGQSNNGSVLHEPSYIVFDEAHSLEEKFISTFQVILDRKNINQMFSEFSDLVGRSDISSLITHLNNIFKFASISSQTLISKDKADRIETEEERRYPFSVGKKMKEELHEFNAELNTFFGYIQNLPFSNEQRKARNKLLDYRDLFIDLERGVENRENVFWVNFLPGKKPRITIGAVSKNLSKQAARLLSDPAYGKLFTSATLSTGSGDSSYFMDGLGLKPASFKGISITDEYPIESPFDYDNNSMLYLSDAVSNPRRDDHEKYLDELAEEVDRLMKVSHGKSLVLFTSKADMRAVYDRVKKKEHDFNIMIQNDNNSDLSKQEFKSDTSSCLFSTGFWEGIDIKGESLEHVIITKLPFPVLDPVTESKAQALGGGQSGFSAVYLPSMLIKLKQGAGRLIRGADDIGVVSILDSRVKTNGYFKSIRETLPFSNITSNIKEVESFVATKDEQRKK